MYNKKIYPSDMINCHLCKDAPCSAVCESFKPDRLLFDIYFDNERAAAGRLPESDPCKTCDAPCEGACVRPGEVPICDLMLRLADEVRPELQKLPNDEERLKTEMCGIPMENPFLLSSSVVSGTYEKCAAAFETGWAGAVFKTICAFDIQEASPRYSAIKGAGGRIEGFKNIEQLSEKSVEENLQIISRLKENYPSKVIVASVMGRNEDEWELLARQCSGAGADAIELNFSCPNMEEGGLGSDIGLVPELVERFTRAAKRGTDRPVLAKLTPNVTSMLPAAEAAKSGGADGIAAINTIKSIIGVDPYTYVSSPAVKDMSAVGGYSGAAVRPVALRFISEMGHAPSLKGLHISAMGGVETWSDALEFILLGADSIQLTTAVMQYGNRIIDSLKTGLNIYLTEKGFASVNEAKGLGLSHVSDSTDVLDRSTKEFPHFDRELCVGCGRCVISCTDGGHEALRLNEEHRPVLDGKRCVGCHLCVLVCPHRAVLPSGKRVVL